MSLANKGKSSANKGLSPSAETRTLISAAKGTAIFVYDLNGLLVKCFSSDRRSAKHFGSNHSTILNMLHLKKLLEANGFYH
jgi:hypothetical protein